MRNIMMKVAFGVVAVVAALAANVALSAPVAVDSVTTPKLERTEAKSTDPHDLMRALASHSDGTFHLGSDGVCRSYHPNGTVIDYVKFAPDHIQTVMKGYSGTKNLTELLAGVDGNDVTHDQAMNPDKALKPVRYKVARGVDEPSSSPIEARGPPAPHSDASAPDYHCYSVTCDRNSRCAPHCSACLDYDGDTKVGHCW